MLAFFYIYGSSIPGFLQSCWSVRFRSGSQRRLCSPPRYSIISKVSAAHHKERATGTKSRVDAHGFTVHKSLVSQPSGFAPAAHIAAGPQSERRCSSWSTQIRTRAPETGELVISRARARSREMTRLHDLPRELFLSSADPHIVPQFPPHHTPLTAPCWRHSSAS